MFPNWLPISFYKELTVETKGKDGKWENLTGHRNESWDLLVYCLAGLLLPTIGWEHIRWDDPPVFAASWDEGNSMIFDINGSETPFIQPEEDAKIDFAALGASLNS
jgi:phage terminase large subunit GpA-like protein